MPGATLTCARLGQQMGCITSRSLPAPVGAKMALCIYSKSTVTIHVSVYLTVFRHRAEGEISGNGSHLCVPGRSA